MRLRDLSLDARLLERLSSLGYDELWPPQVDAIKAGLLLGRNLLITTPTASGKTLIAILAISKTIIEEGGKAVYIAPLRALATEKYREFKRVFEGIDAAKSGNITISIVTGDYDQSNEYLEAADIIVMTNEKYDSLMRHHTRWLDRVTVFIFDEVHLLGDNSRGSTLEFIINLTLNRYQRAQILALSATITNSLEIATWIKGQVVDIKWRPVKLEEAVVTSNTIYYKDGTTQELKRRGTLMQDLVDESLYGGGQTLVFAETRKKAVMVAGSLIEIGEKYLKNSDKIRRVLASLRTEEETTLTRVLRTMLTKGVAFHHAGLPFNYREIVEGLFLDNQIKILVATPTLAMGVNMPARTVIINSVYRYGSNGLEPIGVFEYKQMAGRAGRPKYDSYGRAWIISNSNVTGILDTYVRGEPEPIITKLTTQSLLSQILAFITIAGAVEMEKIKEFFSNSLAALHQNDLDVRIEDGINGLVNDRMVRMHKDGKYVATMIGKRISELYISPGTAKLLISFLPELAKEADVSLPLALLISASPDIQPALQGKAEQYDYVLSSNTSLFPYENVLRIRNTRSFLGIYGWINEYNDQQMLDNFGLEPGDVYRLLESAKWICHSFIQLSKLLGARSIDFETVRVRLEKGVKPELVPLVRIEGIGRRRGRALYMAGVKDPMSLINIPFSQLSRITGIGEQTAKLLIKQASSELASRP